VKIIQDLRREVLEMGDNAVADLTAKAAALTEAERKAGMEAKSAEFEAGGGKLYV
jgi:phosphomethylpyrimidine synthase